MSCAIKLRLKGKMRWAFLSSRGTSLLRIYAVQFATADKAQGLIDENRDDNPEWEWRVVDFRTGHVIPARGGADGIPT